MGVSVDFEEVDFSPEIDWFPEIERSAHCWKKLATNSFRPHPDSDGADNPLDLFQDDRLEQRDRLAARLRREGDSSTADRLEECGTEIMLACCACEYRKKTVTHCDRRYCPLCAPFLANERVMKTRKAVMAMKWPLFITLTIRNVENLNRAVFAHLLKGFRKVRQTQLWKTCVPGGFVACEVTNRGKGWHPHLHILCDCEWLSLETSPPSRLAGREQKAAIYKRVNKELEKVWCKAIGQETASTNVRRKFGKEGAVRAQVEAMKYAVKPGALLEAKGSAAEVIAAMKGTRLFSGFGNCYGLKLDEEKRPAKPCECCGESEGWLPENIVAARAEQRKESRRNRDRDDRRKRLKETEDQHRLMKKLRHEAELREKLRSAQKST